MAFTVLGVTLPLCVRSAGVSGGISVISRHGTPFIVSRDIPPQQDSVPMLRGGANHSQNVEIMFPLKTVDLGWELDPTYLGQVDDVRKNGNWIGLVDATTGVVHTSDNGSAFSAWNPSTTEAVHRLVDGNSEFKVVVLKDDSVVVETKDGSFRLPLIEHPELVAVGGNDPIRKLGLLYVQAIARWQGLGKEGGSKKRLSA